MKSRSHNCCPQAGDTSDVRIRKVKLHLNSTTTFAAKHSGVLPGVIEDRGTAKKPSGGIILDWQLSSLGAL